MGDALARRFKVVELRYLDATSLRNLFIIVITIDSIHNMTCLTVNISPHSPATVDGVDGMVPPLEHCHRPQVSICVQGLFLFSPSPILYGARTHRLFHFI